MDFSYTSEQDALRDSVRRFVEREYGWEERFTIVRSDGGYAPRHWAMFAELGWLGAGLSEEAGGFGGGGTENALIAEELGRGLVTEPFVPHVIATQLLAGIDGETAADLIGPLVMGESIIVPVLQEAAGRGDWRHVDMRADGNRLTGVKTLVEGAGRADNMLVSARNGDEIGLYLVAADAAGVSRTDYRTLDNHRVSDVALDGAEAVLLASGAQVPGAIDRAMEHGLIALCGEALGVMDAALWATRDYLKMRKQFGTAIGNFQALQHRMADMLIEVEMTRSLLYAAFGAMAGDDAQASTAAVSAAKVQVSTGGLQVGAQAIQLHGGIGVTEELNISHHYRRLYAIARQFGDAELHLARFAQARDQN
ncbi:acyl-CoA dehydrogenase [Sphingobium sp.]|uniref:acyl-CoA dehydrogenase family protein n=1 Tax=Sphingobium sp. TaxID=1912891 RepID=UPI002605B6DF|nr:acyl-CoA dehydrogenase [Sphingobium sp.]